MEKEQDGKNWYFEGDELVIKKGKWVIDRYKRHPQATTTAYEFVDYDLSKTPSSDKDRLKEEFEKKYRHATNTLATEHCPDSCNVRHEHFYHALSIDGMWNLILSHAKELGELTK